MACSCCPHAKSAGRLFSFVARRHRRRFAKKGFERSQLHLLAGLERVGFAGDSVLEIGSGVGHLHQTLLERGAGSAVGIDLADGMLDEARRWAGERGLAERTRYVVGDFVELSDELERVDLTLLDKVVCCYPDADTLVHTSLEKTRRVYALTYPRRRWLTRFSMAAGSFGMWLVRSDFRTYVHDPAVIRSWIERAGFRRRHLARTAFWLIEVYERTENAGPDVNEARS